MHVYKDDIFLDYLKKVFKQQVENMLENWEPKALSFFFYSFFFFWSILILTLNLHSCTIPVTNNGIIYLWFDT